MVVRSRNPTVDWVGSSLERNLRDSRTSADATNLLQDSDMEDYLAALRVTNLWQNTASGAPHDVAPNFPDEEIEDEHDTSEDKYILASQTVYATTEDVQYMTKASLKVHDENKLQNLIDVSVNKRFTIYSKTDVRSL